MSIAPSAPRDRKTSQEVTTLGTERSYDRPLVHLVGLPEPKHPGGARYLGFRNYLGLNFVPAPQGYRYYPSVRGWRIDNWLSNRTSRPEYSVGLALMEIAAGLHMLWRRGAVYHAVRGDIDLYLLPRIARKTGNFLVASFHEEVHSIAYYLDGPKLAGMLHGAILLGECQRPYFERYLPPERIFVVHHGVDTQFFHPADEPVHEPVCVTVGAHMRDPKTLAAAMKLVWEANPDVRLIAIGTARKGYVRAAPELNDERLILRDRISDHDLLRAYHGAAIAVHSLSDAVANNALLEQMACGVPIVASDVGAVREYLGEEAGCLVPPRDPAALAAAILQLLGDDAARRTMGVAARKRALDFDHAVIAERLANVYREVEVLG
jgi:glycosyltransferase involved in cell wall biosynthesis